jgi:hypothetical protein
MSYGKLNIWLRNMDCSPKNVWKAELVVKTCGGDYLVDFNPDIIEKLQRAYPHLRVERGSRDGETTIRIWSPDYVQEIKHVEVDVPPGCYIVRAWVCWGNLWTDRSMAIVKCGDDACVNLIVPRADNCIRNVLIPFGVEALEMKLMEDEVQIALNMLIATGKMRVDILRNEITSLAEELKESKAEDASRYIKALEYIEQLVKGIKS